MLGMTKKKIIIFAIVLAAIGGGIFLYFKAVKPFLSGEINTEKPIACTMEAKLCSGGSYVGRTGPNCEFAPCPQPASQPPTTNHQPTTTNHQPTTTNHQPPTTLDIPFTPQAPFGNWKDPRQAAGCEEASILMVMRWVKNKPLSPAEAEKEIIAISDFEKEKYGEFRDLSASSTVQLIKDYFNYQNVELVLNADALKIKNEIANGNAVIVPVNGQKLKNPHYTPPGPIQHMLVIKGYDPETKEFITNDSGTKRGENFRYDEKILENALQDYPTGYHEPIIAINKVMIVIKPSGVGGAE